MGYSNRYSGEITITPPLTAAEIRQAPDLAVAAYDDSPVTQWHAQVRYAADRDMPAATIEPIPDDKLPAIRALLQHAGPDGRQVTRDDLKEIL